MIAAMEDTPFRPIVLLKVGDTFDSLRRRRGDFEHWMAGGLGPTRQPLVVLDPRRGDALPEPQAIAGAVVSGSHAMVSHREAWSEATGAWLVRLVDAGTPVLGICFGHQLLADALGGRADDHPLGMEVGTVEIELAPAAADDPLLQGLPARFAAHVVHSQSALRLPAGAVRLAGNAFEPTHAFRLGERAWGVQFHPEFDAEVMRGYIDRMARALSAQGADPAALSERVSATPAAARLLPRFARIVEAREAGAHAAHAGCGVRHPAPTSCANV